MTKQKQPIIKSDWAFTTMLLIVVVIAFFAINSNLKDIKHKLDQIPKKVCWNETNLINSFNGTFGEEDGICEFNENDKVLMFKNDRFIVNLTIGEDYNITGCELFQYRTKEVCEVK